MGRTLRPAVLLLALSACAEAPLTQGLSPAMGAAIYGCARLHPPTRDWCVVASIPDDLGTGPEIHTLCGRLTDRNARDRCLELSVRHAETPAPASTCREIHSRHWQEICWLEASAAIAPGDLQGAAQLCANAGTHRDTCLATLAEARLENWRTGDPDVARADVAFLVSYSRRLGYSEKFGARLGAMIDQYSLYGRDGIACSAFPSGTGRMACELAFREGDTR